MCPCHKSAEIPIYIAGANATITSDLDLPADTAEKDCKHEGVFVGNKCFGCGVTLPIASYAPTDTAGIVYLVASDKKIPHEKIIDFFLAEGAADVQIQSYSNAEFAPTDTSEEWKGRLSKIVKEQEIFPASWDAFYSEVESFIEKEKQLSFEEGRAAVERERPVYYPSREAFAEAMEKMKVEARQETLSKVKEVIAGMKITENGYTQSMSHRGHYERGHDRALTDLLAKLSNLQ